MSVTATRNGLGGHTRDPAPFAFLPLRLLTWRSRPVTGWAAGLGAPGSARHIARIVGTAKGTLAEPAGTAPIGGDTPRTEVPLRVRAARAGVSGVLVDPQIREAPAAAPAVQHELVARRFVGPDVGPGHERGERGRAHADPGQEPAPRQPTRRLFRQAAHPVKHAPPPLPVNGTGNYPTSGPRPRPMADGRPPAGGPARNRCAACCSRCRSRLPPPAPRSGRRTAWRTPRTASRPPTSPG